MTEKRAEKREINLPTRLPERKLTAAQQERRAIVAARQFVIQGGVKAPKSGTFGKPST